MSLEAKSWDWIAEVWKKSRESWHWPQLPPPVFSEGNNGEFPFQNYKITLNNDLLKEGPLYLENLFDHLILHYIFCPRSLEQSGQLVLATIKGLSDHTLAKRIVNVFSDIVVDSFRLERSHEDEIKVLLGWEKLARRELSQMDQVIVSFLGEYWGIPIFECNFPEVDQLLQVFAPGVRNRTLWPRQCQQTARILEHLIPGILGQGQVRTLEMLNGSSDSVPLAALASTLQFKQYERVLAVLGLKSNLQRWYRDQSYSIEIKGFGISRKDSYPSSLAKWRLTDPINELDFAYSLSISPSLIPGVTTYKREREVSLMAEGRGDVPNLLVVLDSSRSMEGHRPGTKTHKATLAAFKACQFAHQQGAELAAVNFSDKYLVQRWTRDLSKVEDVLVEFICSRTHIPGQAILELANERRNCLIMCITDTHIQNLYMEWDSIRKASELGRFVIFCIDQAGRDKYVEESLRTLGRIYYINQLDDLLKLVIDVAEKAYRQSGESFISSE